MISIADLPTVNAVLNGTSAVLLAVGFGFIRSRKILPHRVCMLSAFAVSILFLISYVTYHAHVGSVRFTPQGWIRPVYFGILISHTVLAVVIVPMAVITLSRALKKRFDRHKKIARWTLPLWFYVSVTGVVIYGMLYHL